MMGWSWDWRELDIPFHFYNISGAEEAWFRFTNYERRLDVEVLSHWDGEELPLGEAIDGPMWLNQIPNHTADAVLMTVQTVPWTMAALRDHTVRLTLNGIMNWEFEVVFPRPMPPQRLDGSWCRVHRMVEVARGPNWFKSRED